MESTLPLTVTLEVEHADLASLERVVAGALAKVGDALWAHLLALLEATLPRPARCACGGPLKANGQAPRQVVTLAGEVSFRRRRFRCTSCAKEVVPLDTALGLRPREAHTLGVRERGLWLVTELSYGRSAGLLDELRGIAVSHGELHAWVRQEGGRLEARREATRRSLFDAGTLPAPPASEGVGKDEVWVSVDGTMVNGRDPEARFEVKAGLVWEGNRAVSRRRKVLEGRFCDGAAGSWAAFAERFTAACAARGVYEAERIYFVSDGAPVIDRIREAAFPTAVELLDWYHLAEAVRTGLGAAFGEVIDVALGAAAGGDVAALLAVLRAHRRRVAPDPDTSERLDVLMAYVRNNARAIANYRLVPYASSGPMEKTIDLVFCRRFKTRGMSWQRRGVAFLLALRLLRLNGVWDDYWRERFRSARLPWPVAA